MNSVYLLSDCSCLFCLFACFVFCGSGNKVLYNQRLEPFSAKTLWLLPKQMFNSTCLLIKFNLTKEKSMTGP